MGMAGRLKYTNNRGLHEMMSLHGLIIRVIYIGIISNSRVFPDNLSMDEDEITIPIAVML